MVKVTALVSTYNSERFFKGRLDDLLAQSLYSKGQLEIVVVNAGSKQGERYIARDYLDRIIYAESLREPIYCAFNRAIALAHGEYLTNANTDDRLRPDALEIMATTLDERPDIALVYANSIVTSTENAKYYGQYEVSDKPPYHGKLAWPEFDRATMLQGCYVGPCPMWRAAAHQQIGLFDASFQLAGDYEFWLRMAAANMIFRHISDVLSLFYDNGMNINNQEQSAMETRRAILRWKHKLELK